MSKTALPGAKRLNAFAMDPANLTIVGIDTDDGVEHPLYDERIRLPLDEALVRNIRKYGVLEPILVRKNGPLIEVVDGRQRVRATREANRRNAEDGFEPILIPCMVRRDKEGDALGVMVSANENRQDDDPITRARKAQRLLNYGQSEDDVAIAFGVTKQALRNLLSVLDLSAKVQKAVSAKRIGFTAATQLTDLTHKAQDEKLKEMISSGATGVVEAKRQRAARKNGAGRPPGSRGKSVSVLTLRKIAEDKEFMENLSDDASYILNWILGDEACAQHVPGLSKLIEESK